MRRPDPRLVLIIVGISVASIGGFGFDQLRSGEDKAASQARESSGKVLDSLAPVTRIDLEAEYQMAAIITLGTHLEPQVETDYLEDRVLGAISTIRTSIRRLNGSGLKLNACGSAKLGQSSDNYAVEHVQKCVVDQAESWRRKSDQTASNHDATAQKYARFVGLSQLMGVLIALAKDILPGTASD